MTDGFPRYRYVGPADVRAATAGSPPGRPIRSITDVTRDDLDEPLTYVVGLDGILRVAPRRSEHVACAAGSDVLGAGELTIAGDGSVVDITNQSTGYCPDLVSWAAVEAALRRAGLGTPDGFTAAVVFRRCPGCGERNIVRDDDLVCAICGADLPSDWNF